MNRLLVALLAGAFACVPVAGLAQDKPAEKAEKKVDKKKTVKKEAAKEDAEKKPAAKKRKKVGGCG